MILGTLFFFNQNKLIVSEVNAIQINMKSEMIFVIQV